MKNEIIYLKKTGFKVIGKETRVKGREYCNTCNTDITIIRTHEFLDGSMVFANHMNITRDQLKKLIKSI